MSAKYIINKRMDEIFGNINTIINLPIKKQAEYADFVCKENINNDEWLLTQLNENIDYEIFNINAIGNLAYISLNTINLNIKDISSEILKNYLKWYKKRYYKEKIKKIVLIGILSLNVFLLYKHFGRRNKL